MKHPAPAPLPLSRQSFYSSKKRSPQPSVLKPRSRDSPLRDSLKRTPVEILSAEVHRQKQHAAQQLALAEKDLQNLLEVEYQEDVKQYMFDMEAKTTASVDLIDQQPELQWYMRPYLVEFLIEIHQQHRLRPETLYLALNIVDRYVSKRIVFKKHYQLVGCAALWIAAKFEDAKDRVPTVPELCQMCCGAYDESAFIQMEGHVLSTINWVVGHPTTESWLRLACVTGQLEEQRTQHVARFVMEITLFHKEFIPFKPSELALASLLLARFMLGKSRRIHDESEPVLRVAQMLDQHLAEHLDSVSVIVIKKYSFPFYSRASTFVSEWYLSGRRFSYYDWTTPSTASMRRSGSETSTGTTASSCNSSPNSANGSFSSDDSCDDEYDEPLTPNTPLPPYSTSTTVGGAAAEVYFAASVEHGKENQGVRPKAPFVRDVHLPAGAQRVPLKRASWENSMPSSPTAPSYRP